jgi:hypothetical protein
MSIYNKYEPRKFPVNLLKTVTMEYFEEYAKDTSKVTPKWQGPGKRRIRIVTTTRRYNLGGDKPVPNVSVIYEYL